MTSGYPRSLLFVPAHRESMVGKAAGRGSDAVVLDLEDSVPPSQKDNARRLTREAIESWDTSSTTRIYVRINSPRFSMLEDDLMVLDGHQHVGIVIPKVDQPVELAAVFDRIGLQSRDVVVNIETPRSILNVLQFADLPGVGGLFLGGEDLTESFGMKRTRGGDELSVPRFLLLAACRAAGIAAYDTVCPEFQDMEVVERDARTASSMGYDGKFAIHPAQIAPIHAAFTPGSDEVDEAVRIVDAYDQAVSEGRGAVAVDGKMIDPPVAERARALLSRAGRV